VTKNVILVECSIINYASAPILRTCFLTPGSVHGPVAAVAAVAGLCSVLSPPSCTELYSVYNAKLYIVYTPRLYPSMCTANLYGVHTAKLYGVYTAKL
jgi:hypothetical protein